MEQDIKERWVSALLSGEYTQGREKLIQVEESEVRYCCLGVLCDLAVKAGVEDVRIVDSKVEEYNPDDDEWKERVDEDLPSAVVEWAGLGEYPYGRDPIVRFGPRSRSTPLSQLNDGSENCKVEPQDFESIANLIKKYL